MPSGADGSKKVLLQKSKVKFYFSTVRSRVIPILKRIEVGDYPSKIACIYVDGANSTSFTILRSLKKQVSKGYELAIDDPVAKLLSRYFTISPAKRKMNHSPGELDGEIDHLSRDATVEYLLMPERVKNESSENMQSDVHLIPLVGCPFSGV